MPIILGILVATTLNHALAALAGAWVAKFDSVLPVVAGTTLGMMLADIPAVLVGHGAGGVQSKAPSHGADARAVAEGGAGDVRRLGMDERVDWWERVAAAIGEIEAAT